MILPRWPRSITRVGRVEVMRVRMTDLKYVKVRRASMSWRWYGMLEHDLLDGF